MTTSRSKEMEKLQNMMQEVLDSNKRLSTEVSNISRQIEKIDVLTNKVDQLANNITSLDRRYEVLASDVHEQATKVNDQERKIKHLESQLLKVIDDLDHADNRSRRNNLRMHNLPEKTEGAKMKAYLASTLTANLKIQVEEADIELAHRIGVEGSSLKPRSVILRLLHFQKRQDILNASRISKGFVINDNSVTMTPDFSRKTQLRREEFWPLREKLHEQGIKTRLKDPASLRICIDKEWQEYADVHAAKDEMKKKFPNLLL